MIQNLQEAWNRFRAFFRSAKLDDDFSGELAAHIDLATEEFVSRGMAPDEARRQAMLRLGGWEQARELHRESRGLPILEDLAQDLKYAVRTLRRDISFTVFAVLIVALGIAASSIVFSVVNTLLIRPLPFHDPARLLWIANDGDGGLSGATAQVDHFLDLRRMNHSLTDMAGYFAFYGVGDNKFTGHGEAERLTGVPVTQNFFPLLGVHPQLGRIFTIEESHWNAPKRVLLSDGFWRRRFAGDPHVLGHTMVLNEQIYTVIGVLPSTFDFPSVFAPGTKADIFFPFPLSPETNRYGNTLAIIGRLKQGVSIGSALQDLRILSARISKAHRERNDFAPRVQTLKERVSGRLRPALMVLAGAVAMVMLIVCANISNLLLARSAARQKELAIRAALGARRGRLIRQALTESLLLAGGGAVLGASLAIAGTRLLAHSGSMSLPLMSGMETDTAALGFTLALAVVTGLVFGLIPALQVQPSVDNALKDMSRGSSGSKRHSTIRSALVVCEIAFACVLLVGAGLLGRSFLRVLDVDLGFQPDKAAALRVDPSTRYSKPEQRNAYFSEAIRLAKTVPGVQAAGLTDALPLGTNRTWGAGAKGHFYRRENYPEAFVRIVTEGYIEAMGISLVAGRDLTERDGPASKPVILINETLARNVWPNENPLGKILQSDRDREVVGVVRDVRHLTLEERSGAEMYIPMRQSGDYSADDLVVRSDRPNAALAADMRRALRPIEPNLPANDFRTLREIVDKSVSPRRFVVLLLAAFALFALLLASLGIYAVIAYSVSQRTREIGIRMALGASSGNLQGNILRQTLALAMLGVAIGMGLSLSLTRALGGILYGVTATDPVTFGSMVVVLTAVAALAGYLPARRASRIDPMLALRTA